MGDVNLTYNPANSVEDLGIFAHAMLSQTTPAVNGIALNKNTPQFVCDVVAAASHWEFPTDKEEPSCLCSTLVRKINH